MPKRFAWSYSALQSFETCPRKHYHEKIAKDFAEKESPAMLDGQRQHKALELRIKDGTPLPSDMVGLEKLCRRVERIPAQIHTEMKVALNEDLEPVTFFARDVWVRCVFDLAAVRAPEARIIDYKSGKRKPDSTQLKLFAATGFALFPEVETIRTAFWWLKTKETDRDTFQREDADLIWREFEPRVGRMRAAIESGEFPPKPSGLCRGYCPVKTCEHWEARS